MGILVKERPTEVLTLSTGGHSKDHNYHELLW